MLTKILCYVCSFFKMEENEVHLASLVCLLVQYKCSCLVSNGWWFEPG